MNCMIDKSKLIEISYIKWKNLATKDIDSLCVSWFYECNLEWWYRLQKNINTPLTLIVQCDWIEQEYNCNINVDAKRKVLFDEDTAMVKLDINLPDIKLLGFIFVWKLFIKI